MNSKGKERFQILSATLKIMKKYVATLKKESSELKKVSRFFPSEMDDERLKILLKRAVNKETAPESLRSSILEMIRK